MTGTTLVVDTRADAGLGAGLPPGAVVLPRHVAAAIRTARERGWEPGAPGSPFRLDAVIEPATGSGPSGTARPSRATR